MKVKILVPRALCGLRVVGVNAGKYLQSLGFETEIFERDAFFANIRVYDHRLGRWVAVGYSEPYVDTPVLASTFIHDNTVHNLARLKCPWKTVFFFLEGKPILNSESKRLANEKVNCIVAPSQFVREKLEENGVRVDAVIYPGIDPPSLNNILPYTAQFQRVKGGKVMLSYIADSQPRKGIEHLLKAVVKAKKLANKDFIVYILTRKNYPNPEPRIIHIDTRYGKLPYECIHALLFTSDAYVHAAFSEGFGLPIAEALWWGKPVICVNAKPMNEIVSEECGILVPYYKVEYQKYHGLMVFENHVYSEDEMAEAIARIVSDDKLRGKLGEKARDRASKFHYLVSYKGLERLVLGVREVYPDFETLKNIMALNTCFTWIKE